VREVPDQWSHDRGVHPLERGRTDVRHQRERARPRGVERR
jgi:hypothetical protein